MKKSIMTITLNPAVDVTLVVERVSKSGRYSPLETITAAGGKGINVARALHSLRASVMATGFLGGKTGDILKRIILGEKIAMDFQRVFGETRINYLVTDKDFRKKFREVQSGPRISKADQQKFIHKFRKHLANSALISFSGSLPPGVENNFYARLIKETKQKNVGTVLDASGAAFRSGIAAQPDIIKPNLQEAEEYFGKKLNSMSALCGAVKEFHRRGVNIVLLTLGAKGAVCSDGKEYLYVKPPTHSIKSDVGCGDAFLAGFLSEFTRGKSFIDGVRSASAAAAVSATQYVPGLVQYGAFLRMRPNINITSL